MKLVCRKHLGALHPVDETGREILRRLPSGDNVMVEFRRSRNINHHRLYWALVSLVWDNIDHERYPSPEDLHGAIKISVGLRTRIVMPDGTVAFMPGSIAWGKMDQDQFSQFYERVCDAVAKWFIPGVTSLELRREVEEMIGARIDQTAAGGVSPAVEAGAGAGGSAQLGKGGPPSSPQPAPAAPEAASFTLTTYYGEELPQPLTAYEFADALGGRLNDIANGGTRNTLEALWHNNGEALLMLQDANGDLARGLLGRYEKVKKMIADSEMQDAGVP